MSNVVRETEKVWAREAATKLYGCKIPYRCDNLTALLLEAQAVEAEHGACRAGECNNLTCGYKRKRADKLRRMAQEVLNGK